MEKKFLLAVIPYKHSEQFEMHIIFSFKSHSYFIDC